jgi:hypothetical protein
MALSTPIKDGLRIQQQAFTNLCQRHASGRAVEQAHAKPLLKRANGLA